MAWLGENGGKYNQNVFNDADSMNFYLIAKYMMGEAIEKRMLFNGKPSCMILVDFRPT